MMSSVIVIVNIIYSIILHVHQLVQVVSGASQEQKTTVLSIPSSTLHIIFVLRIAFMLNYQQRIDEFLLKLFHFMNQLNFNFLMLHQNIITHYRSFYFVSE